MKKLINKFLRASGKPLEWLIKVTGDAVPDEDSSTVNDREKLRKAIEGKRKST